MNKLDFNKFLLAIRNNDYFHVLTDFDKGVKYYAPQDEARNIVAVHHEAGIAVRTDFCEYADFAPVRVGGVSYVSDYAYELKGDELVCHFEA